MGTYLEGLIHKKPLKSKFRIFISSSFLIPALTEIRNCYVAENADILESQTQLHVETEATLTDAPQEWTDEMTEDFIEPEESTEVLCSPQDPKTAPQPDTLAEAALEIAASDDAEVLQSWLDETTAPQPGTVAALEIMASDGTEVLYSWENQTTAPQPGTVTEVPREIVSSDETEVLQSWEDQRTAPQPEVVIEEAMGLIASEEVEVLHSWDDQTTAPQPEVVAEAALEIISSNWVKVLQSSEDTSTASSEDLLTAPAPDIIESETKKYIETEAMLTDAPQKWTDENTEDFIEPKDSTEVLCPPVDPTTAAQPETVAEASLEIIASDEVEALNSWEDPATAPQPETVAVGGSGMDSAAVDMEVDNFKDKVDVSPSIETDDEEEEVEALEKSAQQKSTIKLDITEQGENPTVFGEGCISLVEEDTEEEPELSEACVCEVVESFESEKKVCDITSCVTHSEGQYESSESGEPLFYLIFPQLVIC